jgi:hypothetical protein
MRLLEARPIPTSEPGRLRHTSRRTALLRGGLLLSLLGVLALAIQVARNRDAQHAPLVPSDTTGVLVLDLSASVYEGAFAQTVQKLASGDERVGVVAFSSGAYELVPPGTPARELLPMLRYFEIDASGQLPRNPWEHFRSGTQISSGLEAAHESLLRERVSHGSVVLVSDLEILPDEVVHLAEQVALLRRDGIDVRIVPLFPTPEKQERIKAIMGGSASFLRESEAAAPVRAPEARSLGAAAPWGFLLVGALLVALLAANEGLLSRLEVRR